ncbi:GNAT family N-acetyltransferase [Streptomyces sp. SPB074]|uniref:GNAT family N-acetyltransferase n=1 Tax=Streptomyces sp. (strain SPB074) TaxID=465543 RepID=UPI0001D1E2DE|nr:GNAT family N-acetyltransferase [Streptomyces sp. SPB074]EFG64939.1 acetyltransferase [Streptomyces sp. SPB074]
MPRLVPPALSPGAFSGRPQPVLPLPGTEAALRPWEEGDAEAVRAAYDDPAIQYWHARRADSAAEAAEWIAGWRQARHSGARAEWAIASGGTVLGRCGLHRIDARDGEAEIGYWTVPAARGKGLAPRAVAALTAWALADGFARLVLQHSTRNNASCRVARKAGYALEATRAAGARHADGRHDMHVHVLLNPRTERVR